MPNSTNPNLRLNDADIDAQNPKKPDAPTKFVQCDEVAGFSLTAKVNYAIANAGTTGTDDFSGPDQDAQKPDLTIIDVDLYGVLYTTKLAMHYFISQIGTIASSNQEDTCLILSSSGAGFLDVPRTPRYCSTKWAVRSIIHSLRRTAFYHDSRINAISLWYVRTSILPQEAIDQVQESGVGLATPEDAGQCALRILSDGEINARSIFLLPRKWTPRGFLDLDLEDYRSNELVQEIQAVQVKDAPVELGLVSR
ncbi:hypothetical protein EDB80DRAFT_811752 [Ilyonectria destructans]|nr:hypothetical protein EDB80DRAFT_811752 [Ilyonectria destructans]